MAKWTVVLTLWLLVPAGWPGARSPSGQARPSLSPAELPAIQDSLGGGSVVLTIDSAVLGEERVVSLATPVSFDRTRPERTYPAVIGFDGGSLMAPLLASVGALTRAGQMPEAVVVGIPNTNRIRDLTPPGLSVSGSSLAEGGDRFLDFVEHELLPALARQYRVRGPVVLVGHSSGGILATWAAATRPAFRFVLALDAPAHLGDGWLADRLIERASDEPGDLRYVSMSARFGWPAPLWERLESAAPATWSIHQAALEGETHESMTLIGG